MPLKSPVDFAVRLRVSTVQEYLLIYLLCDGTQLADVFKSFCNHIKGTHKLNPLFFFYGAPSLPYNAMLYQFRGDGNVHPVLLSEPNMAGFFTQMVCGGTAFICTQGWLRQVRMRRSSIWMLTTCMGGPCHRNSLPYNGFRWMSQTELLELKASPKEFFERLRKGGNMHAVMGDFTVPTTIHKMTWDYPSLMPEKASIPEDQLSSKQAELNENNRTTHSSHQQYLLQTMWTSTTALCMVRWLLDFYLQQGIKMTHTCTV